MTELWDWALAAYRGDVPAICLDLQDAHAQNVPFLLWAAWCAREGRVIDQATLDEAVVVARSWGEVVTPLRLARRRLKTMDAEALRDKVKAVELQAERALLDALPRPSLATPALVVMTHTQALMAAADAWSPGCPSEKLARLTQALSEA